MSNRLLMYSSDARARFLTAEEAATLVSDAATVAVAGSGGGVLEADVVLAALEARFLRQQRPRGLTLVHALGIGDREHRGLNRLAHAGLVRRVVGGHWTWSPRMQQLTAGDQIEAYSFPAGVISLLLREIGAARPGLVTRTGLDSFADPRRGGGRCNDAARDELVEVLTFDGVEYLRYKPFGVDVAVIRGSAADPDGNVTCAREPAQLDVLAAAQAARASGGTVIAQVKEELAGPLDPRQVAVPGLLVDAVVVAPDQWQTYESEFDPALCGDAPAGPVTPRPSTLPRALVAARAAGEVGRGDVINVGFGVSAEVVDVLAAQGRLDEVQLCIEQGLIGGLPVSGDLFGISRGPRVVVPSTTQFDLFSGGLLDRCFLGLAQVDASGSVNVSSMDGRLIGPGGFVDISQPTPHAVFCGTFTTKGLQVELDGSELRIVREGQIRKFVGEVDQVTYSGPLAMVDGRRALYVTERAVLELTPAGVELVEVAEGVSIERDILPHMGFEPVIRAPRRTDPRRLLAAHPAGPAPGKDQGTTARRS